MTERKIRVLIAKPGLDGHDRGAKVIARALRDAGMEVIYTGLRQTPEQIAAAALQEDADVIGLSILSGAHNHIAPRLMELLAEKGLDDVLAVSDGDQAIARLDANPPDIVLADIGMPGKDGYEVAAHVKKSPKLSHIPVVLLTGAFEPVDQARADSLGCDGVLAKPFEPQIVIGRVKELLGRPPKAAPPPPSVATPVSPERAAQLDGYFDRLDAAFATISPKPPNGPPLDLPLSYASPKSQFEEP